MRTNILLLGVVFYFLPISISFCQENFETITLDEKTYIIILTDRDNDIIYVRDSLSNVFQFDIINQTLDTLNNFVLPSEKTAHSQKELHLSPHILSIFPFILLLLMIATGPLFYESFWHHNYPKIAFILSGGVVIYYIFGLHNVHSPVHAFFEYFQFISLLFGLYIASGGIYIEINNKSKPIINVTILIIGAIIANLIGTTGASMLLIRPFMRLNKDRIKPYHIVFFIFIVSNVGGALTPIGDPPLFLGFLKGIPFTWTIVYNFSPWSICTLILCVIFYIKDMLFYKKHEDNTIQTLSNRLKIKGKKSFIFLSIIIGSVFIDPNIPFFSWLPSIVYEGRNFSFIRELIMLTAGYLAYKTTNQDIIQKNDFNFEPIKEVAFIFIGIFGTMMPALQLIAQFAQSPEGTQLITQNTLYWGTGILSGFLDNAPTYLNFLTAAMASQGLDINSQQDVYDYIIGNNDIKNTLQLKVISIASVFFGAMTYIGNGPNFMVKAIAQQNGVKMPSFFGYMLRYSIPYLLLVLIVIWLIFVRL